MQKELAQIQEELRIALEGFDLPEDRKRATLTNLMWLARNLHITNGSNPKLKQVKSLILNFLRKRKELGL